MTVSVTLEPQSQIERSRVAVLAQIKAILMHVLKGKSCTVYLFGSQATGTAQPTSDFDVAVLADEDISRELSAARAMLEDSNIPFKVDLVDLRLTAPAFSRAAQTQGVLLWKS